jgi:hypothetical protein
VKVFHQDSPRMRDLGEMNDYFGEALAAGDYNGDGKDDLAIGIAGEDVGSIYDAGAVQILYGATGGLTPMGGIFHQDTPDVAGTAGSFDSFGNSLAAGDLNGDGYVDLAIGVVNETVGAISEAGAVNVLYGGPGGITGTNSQLIHQDVAGIPDEAAPDEQFGRALAAGDFNGDGNADLAIGVLMENADSVPESGAVHVLYGTATGLNAVGNDFWTQGNAGLGAVSEEWDFFGISLAAGNIVGSSHDDLAVGASGEDVGSILGAGAVLVFPGSSTGTTATGGLVLTQENIPGAISEAWDSLGSSLTIGNFDGSGPSELAIGAPAEDLGAIPDCGVVLVYYESEIGEVWHQDSPGILDSAEQDDFFGGGLSAGNGGKSHSGGGYPDRDLAQLITADVDFDSTKPNKRRHLNRR